MQVFFLKNLATNWHLWLTQPGTYVNVLKQHGMYELFDAFAISELATAKPDQLCFKQFLIS